MKRQEGMKKGEEGDTYVNAVRIYPCRTDAHTALPPMGTKRMERPKPKNLSGEMSS